MTKRFLLLITSFLSAFSFAELLLITEDWPPYNYQQHKQLRGFSVEIVQAMLEEMDLDLRIQLLPGARGETLLENNPNVISFSLFRSPERENQYQWIGPLANETIYFYKHADSPIDIKSIEEAKQFQVGSLNKGFVFSELSKHGFTGLQTVSNQSSLPKMLISKRIDLMVNLPVLGHVHILQSLGHDADEIENTGVVLATLPLYLAASKEIDPAIIARWQQSLDSIKESGLYDEIYSRYLSK